MPDVEKLSDEFKGNLPKINIRKDVGNVFTYICTEADKALYSYCSRFIPLSDKCFDCIGMNIRFAKFYRDNNRCSCGYQVNFGYFVLIFHIAKAGLLPDDFMMTCCDCYDEEEKPTCEKCSIDG